MSIRYLLITYFVWVNFQVFAQQTMHNFTVTDVTGQQHRLYEDYLNKDKVVVIKFFFTTCPPCIANAPFFQEKYVDYEAGSQDVEFFSITTIPGDFDAEVIAFEHQYHQTMKGISVDGGALTISNEFKSGAFGSWYGTPSFVVIAPDQSMQYPVFFNNIDDAIALARSKKLHPTTTFSINPIWHSSTPQDPNDIKFYLKPKNTNNQKIEIHKDHEGIYTFNYPSDDYPEMHEPEVIMESTAPAYSQDLSSIDLVKIQRHIIELEKFNDDTKIIASDLNGDNRLTASDLTILRKIILGSISTFPNGVPSYKTIPEVTNIIPNPGHKIDLEINIVKVGNVD